jgi:cell division protein FtsL
MSRADLLLTAFLMVAVVASGIAVVHAKYQSRQLFVAMQELRRERDNVAMQWGRLQLELGTVGNHALIEKLARQQLGMRMPRPADVVVLER